MGTYLDEILDHHRAVAAADSRSLDALIDEAGQFAQPRGFRNAIRSLDEGLMAVIAEIKRRSPSRGDLAIDLDPAETAGAYMAGGATCLSVLTDQDHFGGSAADLRSARGAVPIPVLRKDFTVDPRDVCDAALMGADAVLLIAAALDDSELSDFLALSRELGLDSLAEVHDESELERVLAAGADLVGVNQRDLNTFQVDSDRARRVGACIPAGVERVAESGVRTQEDAAVLYDAGFRAILVGESLVTSGDPGGAVADLVAAGSAGTRAG
ncbi:MAG: indole-3-glycerol phosphate synthase TrpC [Acidimicrobiales bacterium]|nr:indole-3-glycerol phosphate synthase TrpC [Acidimicrobiales bacterium]